MQPSGNSDDVILRELVMTEPYPSGISSRMIQPEIRNYEVLGMALAASYVYWVAEPTISAYNNISTEQKEDMILNLLDGMGIPREKIYTYESKDWKKYYYDY